MIIHNFEQGSEEWAKLRSERFTASNFVDLFAKETTQAYQNLINDVVYGKITGEPIETFQNDYMKRGSELEPFAREAYELETFTKVNQVGFIELDEWVGYSPDGLIGEDGLIEIKCTLHNALIGLHMGDKIPSKYFYQMQGGLWVSEREWCDFYVWHPKIKPYLKRVYRSEKDIEEIKIKIEIAIKEAQKRINTIGNSK